MVSQARLKSPTALRDAMQAKGITVRVLADRVGYGKSIVGMLRSGARTSCRQQLAVKIAAVLDVPANSLFEIGEE